VAVLHNNDLNQVTWELRAMGGTPKFIESQALPEMSYADVAASFGLGAIAVDDPDKLAGAWETALSADRPYLLDVRCDPEVPPIPPHADLSDEEHGQGADQGRRRPMAGHEGGDQDQGAGAAPVTEPPVATLEARAYTVPTDRPEADGTLAWDATTMVVVEARAEGEVGTGWTYAPAAPVTCLQCEQ